MASNILALPLGLERASSATRMSISRLHAVAGLLDVAAERYVGVLALTPDHRRTALELAGVLASRGQCPEAIELLEEAAARASDASGGRPGRSSSPARSPN